MLAEDENAVENASQSFGCGQGILHEAENLRRVIQDIGSSIVHLDRCERVVSRLERGEEDSGQIQ